MTAPISQNSSGPVSESVDTLSAHKAERYAQIKPPDTACDIVDRMLKSAPKTYTNRTGGGLTVSSGGHAVYVPGYTSRSVDEDTNLLFRAQLGCERNRYLYIDQEGNSLFVDQEEYYDSMRKRIDQEFDRPRVASEKCVIS